MNRTRRLPTMESAVTSSRSTRSSTPLDLLNLRSPMADKAGRRAVWDIPYGYPDLDIVMGTPEQSYVVQYLA